MRHRILALFIAVCVIAGLSVFPAVAAPVKKTVTNSEEITVTVEPAFEVQDVEANQISLSSVSPANSNPVFATISNAATSRAAASSQVAAVSASDVQSLIQESANGFSVSMTAAAAPSDPGNTNPSMARTCGTATAEPMGFEEYVRANGQSRWNYVDVPAGKTLAISMYQPNTTDIDYDLYVYSLSGTSLYYLPSSINSLFGLTGPGNGSFGEEFTIPNTTSSTVRYYIELRAVRGCSTTLPTYIFLQALSGNIAQQNLFAGFDQLQLDERIKPNSNYLLTAVCGKWFELQTSSQTGLKLGINPNVSGAVYDVSVWTVHSDAYGKYAFDLFSPASDGRYYLPANSYFYVKVESSNFVFNPAVLFTLTTEIDNGGLMRTYTYTFVDHTGNPLPSKTIGTITRPWIQFYIGATGKCYDVEGNPLQYVPALLTVNLSNGEVRKNIPTAYTDSDGYYNAQNPVGPPAPTYTWNNHYYDIVPYKLYLNNTLAESGTAFHY